MQKMNRSIDENKMNQSKNNTMEFVMNKIQNGRSPLVKFRILKPALSILSIIIIALIVVFNIGDNGGEETPFTLSEFESQKIAEISYLSSNLIGSSFSVTTNSILRLSDEPTTEFEENDDLINMYFDTLKVFLEEENFNNNITTTTLENSDYDLLLEFNQDDLIYAFYITIDESIVTGELHIDETIYEVTGKFEESDTELKIELTATNADDYVKISYKSESQDEVETKYNVEQSINNVVTTKNIKVSKEDNEEKVVITEGQNSYTLKKELEDNQVQFKLEYEINGVSGEARITESIDDEGNKTYTYQIKENGKEKSIVHGKPDYKHNENPGKGNGNGNGNQSNNEYVEYSENII